MSLYEMTRFCQDAYASREELDAAIELAYQTHQLLTASMTKPAQLAEPDRVAEYVEISLTGPYENCATLTAEQRSEAEAWLEKAAELGNPLAMIEYGQAVASEEDAVDWFSRAWSLGNVDALGLLARSYGVTYESGARPENKIKAYAAFYAFSRLTELGLEDHGEIAARWNDRVQSELASIERTLQPHEIEEGRTRAREIIRDNVNCCLRM
jgi:TPR repeat protein